MRAKVTWPLESDFFAFRKYLSDEPIAINNMTSMYVDKKIKTNMLISMLNRATTAAHSAAVKAIAQFRDLSGEITCTATSVVVGESYGFWLI